MSNHPEGLHLALTPHESLAIFDAQDVMWIEFGDGGHGDPIRWHENIVLDTCKALGITYAINELSEEVSIEHFLEIYNGELDFVE